VEFLLFLAVPTFVISVGLWLAATEHPRRYIAAVSNHTLGLLAIAVGSIDLVVRVLRATVLR
jgi:uncharacterized membrane protein